ncbi:UDP-N-acetylmuramoyl-L-alanyl-D-glutamate--2,6-diaminopimelate ligase [Clostridium sp. AM58-1XD]|uniref:UDP-N-acetylmuramoyl-L-alanyl-D-glutamate--2, 6-diaminopimelate ligase n=1 Tax=Clostridium sp. AM58-1XD TaxID=2292307 RepID=UPI000E529E26|nr:UDP-N-acetylmuramoyl-L-alanyl-D-glutamate--2,6-diaminopimelate ligase [Clostridium sp. AM58-1XD]RGY99431.1 UDP-N-acetylmuramoyl-L-alanyl-D-glutamate--2,6-diaminopimelate ligase [Clostridium sp. AM58-1XD]
MKFSDWLNELTYEMIQGDLEQEVTDVIYDSRKAGPGCVFVCMKGTKTDSHTFIPDVAAAGTKVLVVEEDVPVPEGITAIRVENSRNALALLSAARFGYPLKKMVSVGVTGTKGKTTTTHMMKAVLEAAGKKVGMIGTTGAVIGEEVFPTRNTTPESYELQEYFYKMAEAGCDYVIMEVSSQGIKMHRTDGIVFDYGVFTNISPDHIGPDEHADFNEYLYYKSRIFHMCRKGIYNKDDEHAADIIREAACPLWSFGVEAEADFAASDVRHVAEPGFVGMEFDVKIKEKALDVKLGMPGMFNVHNALAAVAMAALMEVGDEAVKSALQTVTVNGRMETVYSSALCTVIVDYAHNAVSMESLLTTLRAYHPKRLVCVFGCGGNRAKDRRYSMGEIGGRMADLCIITADNSRFEKTEDIIADIRSALEPTGGSFIEIPDRREAIEYSIFHAEPGDMIAIIGKGHEDYQEMNGVRTHFLDREVIEETVKKL